VGAGRDVEAFPIGVADGGFEGVIVVVVVRTDDVGGRDMGKVRVVFDLAEVLGGDFFDVGGETRVLVEVGGVAGGAVGGDVGVFGQLEDVAVETDLHLGHKVVAGFDAVEGLFVAVDALALEVTVDVSVVEEAQRHLLGGVDDLAGFVHAAHGWAFVVRRGGLGAFGS